MAKQQGKPGKFKFKGFENLEFTADERSVIADWVNTFDEEPTDAVVVLVEAGYKVGIGWDEYHQTNQISLTCKDQASPYYGVCFTMKHNDVGKGLLVLRYVYDTLLRDAMYTMKSESKVYDW